MNNIHKLEKDIEHLLYKEEIYWMHQSLAKWLKSRDKNIKYFYYKAIERK